MKSITPQSSSALTVDESARLAELEPIIERGLSTFIEVGQALLEISDRRLYKATHSSFKEYVEAKWNMSVSRAYQLCEAAEVVKSLPESLHNCGQINEGQARELAKVPKEKRLKVLKVATAKGRRTAKSIRSAAAEVVPDKFTTEIDTALAQLKPEDRKAAAEILEQKADELVPVVTTTALDELKHWWIKATAEEQAAFLKYVGAGNGW